MHMLNIALIIIAICLKIIISLTRVVLRINISTIYIFFSNNIAFQKYFSFYLNYSPVNLLFKIAVVLNLDINIGKRMLEIYFQYSE